MTTASPGGAGGCTSGRASESRASFFDTLFQKSCVELEKAKPFDRSRVDIAAIASLDGVDPGDCEVAPLSCSVLSQKLATGDAEIDAGSPLRSRLTRLEPHPAMAVQAEEIKEEGEDEEVAIIADPRDAAAVSPSCSLRAAARLMERLGVAGPAPFLRKTYDMVSDPGTDPMVSWGSSRDSFVVWDQHEFSKQVLPGYFKHSNFSSFIRQLNTYGFRKIDSDRWEFANKGFQEGKKHLLNNIKRRGKFSNHTKPWSSTVTLDYPKGGKEAELEMLKKDGEAVKAEILKLREERENLQRELNQVAKRIRHAECRHWRMLLFLSKAAKSPNLDQHLIQERRQKRELETCESSKKSKLLGPDSEATECLLQVIDHKIRSPNVDCLRIIDDSAQMESRPDNVVPEDFETVQMRNWWPPPMGGGDFRDQMAGTSRSDLPSVLHEMREKLLGDNVIVGDVAEDAVQVEEELLAAELESLIEKPCGWSEYTSELGEQAAGLMP